MKQGDITIQDQADRLPRGKSISFTRDLSVVSGSVSYTGFGFQPTMLYFACVSSAQSNTACWTVCAKTGGTSSTVGVCDNNGYVADSYSAAVYPIKVDNGGNNYWAQMGSWDIDGFTLAWTKQGSPTGTLNSYVLATK
jgi:hypothetical protein